MADDSTMRSYRPSQQYRREDADPREHERVGGADPLAELARLIGQSDPFDEFGRTNPRSSVARAPELGSAAPPTAPDWRETSSYETVRTRSASQSPPPFPPSTVPRHDFEEPALLEAPAEPDAAMHDTDYAPHPHYAGAGLGHDAAQEPYFDDGAPMGPNDDEMYDDAPRARRGGKLLTAVILVGCAMLGTAGAYGYRTYYVNPGSGPAPVIVADKTPTKVVPTTEGQASKVIQDRIGEQGGNERMVSREEQPVEIKPPGTSAAPRVVLPAPVAPVAGANTVFPAPPALTPPPQTAAAPPAPAAGAPKSAPGATANASASEPKRVRTVTIRPDGTDLSGRPVGGLGGAPTEPASARPAGRPAQTAARGAPLSLDPQTSAQSAPAPARAAPATPPAPRLAAAPATGGSGSYVVQVSSQRSEAEAQASYRALQAKYPNLLNGHEPIVRRADLGAKGVFYRTMVGPFASAGEAGQFCNGLKAAGGQCIIHRN